MAHRLHIALGLWLAAGCGEAGAVDDEGPRGGPDAGADAGARPPDPSTGFMPDARGNGCTDRCCLDEVSPLPSSVDFARCVPDFGACDLATFGTASRVVSGYFHPGGSATEDGGAILGAPIDLRTHAVLVHASVRMPDDCDGTCIDGAGIGFAQIDPERSIVEPAVALIVRGSTREASLVVGGRVAGRMAITRDADVELEVDPEGRVTARAGGTTLSAELAPFDQASLVLFGRNENPGPDDPFGTSFGAMTIETRTCDVPGGWSSPIELAIDAPASVESPSLLDDGDDLYVAYSDGRDIALAKRTGDGPFVALPKAFDVPLDDGTTRRHPSLVATGGHGWHLYFAASEASGLTHIARAGAATVGEPLVIEDAPILYPDADRLGFDQPSVAIVTGPNSGTLIAVRAFDRSSSWLELYFRPDDDPRATVLLEGDLESQTHSAEGAQLLGAFAEIASPSIVSEGRHWALYFAGRRGARWSIGLLRSPDLIAFTSSGIVLEGDDDRIAVFDPEVRVVAGAAELVYVGTNGETNAIARVSRPLP